ncbi:hypothetical protein CVT24_005824 [Panaeolus cyanescens]|uniref:Uncharacterized protein n=1 Tax=Panaeolus cyanescens TaxID=181874 RepID=A0A409V910_9AGAR|nr:hypothetical protein CVT24_005824 [Panaeolus cyanescens]
MSDVASIRSSRASSVLSRPHPMGPRGRQGNRASHLSDSSFTSASPQQNNNLDLPEFGSHSITSPPMSPASVSSFARSDRKSLPSLAEESRPLPEPAEAAPSYMEDNTLKAPTSTPIAEEFESSASASEPEGEEDQPKDGSEPEPETQEEEEEEEDVEMETPPVHVEDRPRPAEVQVHHLPEVPPPQISPPFEPEPLPVPTMPRIVASTPVVQPKLIIPQAVKFESTPIQWKSLPLDAALWTVDSDELQTIVSRAIRGSAQESSIRLVTLENLDKVLPAELERLDNLRLVTQSKYRFLCHRRAMLFQALNSTSLGPQKDADGTPVVSKLTAQLAETIGECDQHLAEVINITDQIGQIHRLMDIHSGSALAIALRKLNGSYARRTADLKATKERIAELEAELEDAWKEAEKMAQELDDYEAAINADEEGIIETAEVVPVPTPSAHVRRLSAPMSPTLVAVTVTPSGSPPRNGESGPISPLAPNFTFPPAHLKAKETEANDVPDTVSVRSTRSAKSYRSGRTGEGSHSMSLQAAKRRSHRASQSSLRLSTSHFRRPSNGHRAKSPATEDQPPVPEIPIQFSSAAHTSQLSSARASSFLLHLDSTSTHSPSLRRQCSLDTVCTTGRSPRTTNTEYKDRGRGADDLYVRSWNSTPNGEITLVPRTPPVNQTFADMYFAGEAPRPPPKDPSKTIPSMWMNADTKKAVTNQGPVTMTPSTSSDHAAGYTASVGVPLRLSTVNASSVQRQSSEQEPPSATSSSATRQSLMMKSATMNKLKTLTKRYSVSLPLFNTKVPSLASARRSG